MRVFQKGNPTRQDCGIEVVNMKEQALAAQAGAARRTGLDNAAPKA
jgi:hypothetical protein